MSINKDVFKAEVHRRSRERIAARKRAKKRILYSCATLTVCLVLFTAVVPNVNLWQNDEAVEDREDGLDEVQQVSPDAPSKSPGMTAAEEDCEAPSEPDDSKSAGDMPHLESIIVTDGGVSDSLDLDTRNKLLILIAEIYECEQTPGYSKPDPAEGCQIVLTYEDGSTYEFVWIDSSWYNLTEENLIILTERQIDSLRSILPFLNEL